MTPGAGICRTPLPNGFKAAGIHAGVRRYRPDLGLIVSMQDCVASGVFTQHYCKAAPVQYSQALLPSSKIRAIITNSGQANAATGAQGITDNARLAQETAAALCCDTTQILTASTGVIGVPLAIDKLCASIPRLVDSTSTLAEPFAVAILTTDLVPKTVHRTIKLSGGTVNLTGIAKGSGMIHPNMATMLGFFLTDAELSPIQAQELLQQANEVSFNRISVDGETSTNDCAFLLANGMRGIKLANAHDEACFANAMQEVAILLAKAIARDGEGARKLIEVNVHGIEKAPTAVAIARAITTSPLIKTAVHGASPNWGRILARIGQVHPVSTTQLTISIQGIIVFAGGNAKTSEHLEQAMQEDTIVIDIQLGEQDKTVTAWGCDLSEKYVQINAEYFS